MTRCRTFRLGAKPVDLAYGSGTSAVVVQLLRNSGKNTLYLGHEDTEHAVPLAPGESLPQQVQLGATDPLYVWAPEGDTTVNLVVGWA